MQHRLPLPSLLSHALVAFVIEFDNEFEHRLPHRTTRHSSTSGSRHAPWLVSMVMWTKFVRFIPVDGITVAELRRIAGLNSMGTWLTRLSKWWKYLAVEQGPEGDAVRLTPAGCKAREIWEPLTAAIETRWRQRFGEEAVEQLRRALARVAEIVGPQLPDSLPILGYGLFSNLANTAPRTRNISATRDDMPALLSRVLLAFANEFESESDLSLAICANVLRLVEDRGIRLRDLPRLACVSKEAIAMATKYLEKYGYTATGPESPGSRTRLLTLTAKGRRARDAYRRLIWDIEQRWQASIGEVEVQQLRQALERLAGKNAEERSPLFAGLEPYPAGWRASVPKPQGLPHYPMILHRGGWPDGS